jgi:hypothetical protein
MNKVDIDMFCRGYDGLLSQDQCDEYIELYEETLLVDKEKQRNLSVCFNEDGTKVCGNCNCMRVNPQEYSRFEELNNFTIDSFSKVVDQYKKDVNIHHNQWPDKFGYEELRIKRFLIEGGGKDNDDFFEGETCFPLFNAKVKPKKGMVFIFPPTWTYSHHGASPIGPSKLGAKYFIMTHLNYIDLVKVNKFDGETIEREVPGWEGMLHERPKGSTI